MRWVGAIVAWGLAIGAFGVEAHAASASGQDVSVLSDEERDALLAGHTVSRPLRFERGTGSYVGGVSYQIVEVPASAVYEVLAEERRLPDVLPNTHSVRWVGRHGRLRCVEISQGTRLVRATYTVCLEHDRPAGLIRFWLDPSRPHGIRDVWGYFRVEPLGAERSLVTVAVALDLGPGLVRLVFEDAVQALALSTPRYIRDYVEPRRPWEAGHRSSGLSWDR